MWGSNVNWAKPEGGVGGVRPGAVTRLLVGGRMWGTKDWKGSCRAESDGANCPGLRS